MKIALVNPPGDKLVNEHLEPPLGLISIASFVKEQIGVDVKIIDLTEYSISQSLEILIAYNADILGFTVYCTKTTIVRNLLIGIHEHCVTKPIVILGGPNPSALPEHTLANNIVDIVVKGEGEKAFCNILKEFLLNGVKKTAPRIIVGEQLHENEFPILNYELVASPATYGRKALGSSVIPLEASRGCAYSCFFCNSNIMGSGHKGITFKKSSSILKEIELCKRRGFGVFKFNDDSFTYVAIKTNLLDLLCQMNIKFRIFANIGQLSKELLISLAEAGCFHISVGIESYNPKNMHLFSKNHTQKQIKEIVNFANSTGIIVRAYFIVGLPFDSDKSIAEFMERVSVEVNFLEYSVYPLIPYPGTVLWNDPSKFGYTVSNRDFDTYLQIGIDKRQAVVLRHTNFNETDIQRWLEITDFIFQRNGKTQTFYSKIV